MDSTAYTPGSFSAVRRFRSKSPDKLFIEQFLEPERNTMVFVHGFNERYDDTVYGFAQILHDSGALGEVAPVLFTGPRKGMSSPTATTAKARIILAIL